MATSIIPDPRPLFIKRTYVCGTGTIYPITDSSHSARKTITSSNLGITSIPGYSLAGIDSYNCYDTNITVLTADPNGSNVLYLLNYTSWNISTTAQVTVVYVRSDKAGTG